MKPVSLLFLFYMRKPRHRETELFTQDRMAYEGQSWPELCSQPGLKTTAPTNPSRCLKVNLSSPEWRWTPLKHPWGLSSPAAMGRPVSLPVFGVGTWPGGLCGWVDGGRMGFWQTDWVERCRCIERAGAAGSWSPRLIAHESRGLNFQEVCKLVGKHSHH